MGSDHHVFVAQLEGERRRQRVEEMLLHGMTNPRQMSVALGVHPNTISKDVKLIRSSWLNKNQEQAQAKAAVRIKQLEAVMMAAWASYERSRQDEIEITERYCDNGCNHGLIKDKVSGKQIECPKCKGDGYVQTKKIRGQAGDCSFLLAIKACIVEISRIEGIYPAVASSIKRDIERAMLPDGTIMERIEESYSLAPDDMIINFMVELDNIRMASKKEKRARTKKTIDTTAKLTDEEGAA